MPSGRKETPKYAGMSQKEKLEAYQKASYEKHKEKRRKYGREYGKIYREKNSEVVLAKKKDQWLMMIFKKTVEWYNDKLKSQDGHCALCNTLPTDRRMQVDHDHNCCPTSRGGNRKTCGKCTRGLLCEECNTRLGFLEQLLRDFPNDYAEIYLRNTSSEGSWTKGALRYLKHYSEESIKRYVASIPTLERHQNYEIVRYPPKGETQERFR